jgi:hypothetical protein
MKEKTRYSYEQRINELEREIALLRPYRTFADEILQTIGQVVSEGKTISTGWIIGKFRCLLK